MKNASDDRERPSSAVTDRCARQRVITLRYSCRARLGGHLAPTGPGSARIGLTDDHGERHGIRLKRIDDSAPPGRTCVSRISVAEDYPA